MRQLKLFCSYTEHTEKFAKKVLSELKHAICSTTLIVENMYTDESVVVNTIPCMDASIRLYFVSKTALENAAMYQEIKYLLEHGDKKKNVFFLSSSSLGASLSFKDEIKFWVQQTQYDTSKFANRYRLYSVIYEALYGEPKQHTCLAEPAGQYWYAMWILSCNFDSFDDINTAQNLLEKSAAASNMFAMSYTGYSLCCGALPFDVNKRRGIQLMMNAANLGHPIAQLNIGKWLFKHGEFQKAVPLLRAGVREVDDDGGGYSLLSQCYAEGLGVSKNFVMAEKYALLSKVLKFRSGFKSMSSHHLYRNLAINSEVRF